MLTRNVDPILSIATAPGRGAVGIVRISARKLAAFIEVLLGRSLSPRVATYLPFRDRDGMLLDQGIAIYFNAPHSYTGEDVLELQAHGGPVVLELLVARCLEVAKLQAADLPDLRLAEPGEFTQRAFLNDKLDLAQAEAVADLIDASTEAAARSASQSLAGAFSREVHSLLDLLIKLRTLVEATLDFPEEEIDFLQRADARGQVARLQELLDQLMQRATQGALLREGIKVVIVGQPNAGKSSLLNALAGAELAIVTPIAGTTRDRVEQTIQINGVPVHVIDTAGLRESQDEVEKIGIARAWEAMQDADAVLFLHDLARIGEEQYMADDYALNLVISKKIPKSAAIIPVWNKSDKLAQYPEGDIARHEGALYVSAKTGAGLEDLRERLLKAAGWQIAGGGSFMARERHLQALGKVDRHIHEASAHLEAKAQSLDLLAEELRLAQVALNSITGEFDSEDLLGAIFSKFCIGK